MDKEEIRSTISTIESEITEKLHEIDNLEDLADSLKCDVKELEDELESLKLELELENDEDE